jgi:hypothetical protein
MRDLLKKYFAYLANKAIQKNNSEVFLIYGWDWSEGVREAMYNAIDDYIPTRRNTSWIRWDLGLPLAILGYDYNKEQHPLKLILIAIRANLALLFSKSLPKEVLLVSLHAKNKSTFDYWVSSISVDTLIILPYRSKILINNKDIQDSGINLVDLSSYSGVKNVKNDVFIENTAQLMIKLFDQLQADKLLPIEEEIEEDNIEAAVEKIDLQRFYLDRLKANLLEKKKA